MMGFFNLQYGSFDFLIEENGEIVFLELNPTGAFGWIDKVYEGQIYRKVVDTIQEMQKVETIKSPRAAK